MQLPSNEVGISDIIAHRECPQRFAFSMRRHVALPERFQLFAGEKDDPPEAASYATAYGSAVHSAIEIIENSQCSDEEAMDAVWPIFQHWLEPSDVDRMLADLAVYRQRSTIGYRLVGTELELRMPLLTWNGEQIYFRARIDVLYQRIDNPAVFFTRDYKSGRFPKTDEEVHKDLQQWAYNVNIHFNYPECRTLVQSFDQLRFGAIPTSKSSEQRAQMTRWLQIQVKSILADNVLAPKQNDWCFTCPLMMDCRVTHRATDWWINRIEALAPSRKEGRKTVLTLSEEHMGFDTYTELLPRAKNAAKTLERYIEAVEDVLKKMPEDRRGELGYTLGKPRALDTWDADALRKVAEIAGDDFFQIAGITKKALEGLWGAEDPRVLQILGLATKKQSAAPVKAVS